MSCLACRKWASPLSVDSKSPKQSEKSTSNPRRFIFGASSWKTEPRSVSPPTFVEARISIIFFTWEGPPRTGS